MSSSTTDRVIITHDLGLHLRAAGSLVQVATRFHSEISIRSQSSTANAKSIMSVLSLGAVCGTELEITSTGDDAPEATQAILQIIKADFNLSQGQEKPSLR